MSSTIYIKQKVLFKCGSTDEEPYIMPLQEVDHVRIYKALTLKKFVLF